VAAAAGGDGTLYLVMPVIYQLFIITSKLLGAEGGLVTPRPVWSL